MANRTSSDSAKSCANPETIIVDTQWLRYKDFSSLTL